MDAKCTSTETSEVWTLEDGTLHREDGPAISSRIDEFNTTIFWYYQDAHYAFDQWCIKTKKTTDEIIFLKLKYGV